VSSRIKHIVAVWFVVQIALPFTAPMQAWDLSDLFGHRHAAQPETSSTPLPDDLRSAVWCVAPADVPPLHAALAPAPRRDRGVVWFADAFDDSPAAQSQQAVLRV
jgi:hypothetical protein